MRVGTCWRCGAWWGADREPFCTCQAKELGTGREIALDLPGDPNTSAVEEEPNERQTSVEIAFRAPAKVCGSLVLSQSRRHCGAVEQAVE
jgi:hypothetical protein